ncbi:MAG: hypothetical protein JWN01_675 [Patescibacteria group bacterium]|nr:hypothetical protein [Patescibacteria group bacterium]
MLRRIFIIFGYLALTIIVVGVTFVLVAYGKDYSYDFPTRQIIQKGHVILGSLPSGVRVYESNRDLKKKTPYQAAYKVGSHTFRLVKDGFWPWQKTFEVVAGQVSLARYIILLPKQPAVTVLDTKPQIVAQSMSKDHRHLAYVTGGPEAALYTLDMGDPKPVKIYTPKLATPTVGAEVLTEVTWSDDASHLLVVTNVDGLPVHKMLPASGGDGVNLTEMAKLPLTGLRFSATNWRQLYWATPEGLRRLDVESKSVSAVLADKVTQFWPERDHVFYVRQTELGRSLWSLDNRDRHQELIQALAESDTYSLDYINYQGHDQLAVVPARTQTGTLYTDILGDTPVAKIVARGVTAVSFAPDGHLALFSSPTAITGYDLERSSLGERAVVYSITGQPGQLASLSWFDSYHLLLNRGGRLYWSEFDGANRVDLGAVAGNLPGYSSADQRSVVTFRPDGVKTQVAQIKIRP